MKNKKKVLKVASRFAFISLVVLILASIATIFAMRINTTLANNNFPGAFATLFFTKNYLGTIHSAYATGQILNNLVAYFFMLSAVLLFIFSLVLIKHSPSLKLKVALMSLFLFVPATIGLTGGFIDFVGHGLGVLLGTHGARDSIVAMMLIVTYVLDFVYYIAAIIYLVIAVRTTLKINKGELPLDVEEEGVVAEPQEEKSTEEKIREEEEEAEKRAKLLADIRTIVREELERLDRVVIAKEVVTTRHVEHAPAKPEPEKEKPAPAPKPEPAPVAEPEDEDSSKLSIQRVPFVEKIVKADKDIQDKYNELKNEILAYGASSRISIGGDTFRLHRKSYVKITLVGKTLKVYFALNPQDYKDSTIPVFDASDKSAYEDVPALLKVKSNLSLKRAKELVAAAFAADGIEKIDEVGTHNFVKDIRADLRKK